MNEELDYCIIEIKEEDEIKDCFLIDNLILDKENGNQYLNNDTYISQFPEGRDLSFAQGEIESIKDDIIKHSISTLHGSSGSPILIHNNNNFKIIGIHKAECKKENFNLGIYMKYILNDINDKNFSQNKCNNTSDNFIICEYDIKNKDNVQILNCYEEIKKKHPKWNWDKIGGVGNEKEIKENCELFLNDNKI